MARVIMGVFMGFGGALRAEELRSGDLSWPPSGKGVRSSGSLMGPNGETVSWTLSHDPIFGSNVGALGGLDGFQGTLVVFTAPASSDFSLIFGNRENVVEVLVVGPFLVSLYFVDELEAAIVVPTWAEIGNLGSEEKSLFGDFVPRDLRFATLLCRMTRK